jgi:uncharacterized Zn-binding protein involved in type VI secretion
MGLSVGVNPPKTPVTEGSHGIASNTIPNVCKMPGPPAPFVPAPLPNIAKSELSPKDYSKTVKIEGKTVAIRGSTFQSIGDEASKGTGGGLISANTQGPAKFITPGSMNVKFEGKNVQLLSDSVLNNCGPSGSPPNTGATMMGVGQGSAPQAKCPPHDIEWEPLTPEGEEKRKQREEAENKKRDQEIRKHTYDFNRALESPHLYPPGTAEEALRLAVIKQGQKEDAEYAKRVAKETKAKWTGIKYWCNYKCDFNGDIDVISDSGVVKECKNDGLPKARQIEKYKVLGPLMFGAPVPIHIALPGETLKSFFASREAQELEKDVDPQVH